MAENLRLLDPDMLTAVVEFDQMHEGYDQDQPFVISNVRLRIHAKRGEMV